MKKIRYYAPYWVLALIVIAAVIVYMLFFRFQPFVKLPELAATLESNEYFLREDGAIMKKFSTTKTYIGVVDHDGQRYRVRNFDAKPISEMLPHEYAALICDAPIYVRKDGSVFTTKHETYTNESRYFIEQVCTPSELPEDASEAEIEMFGKHDRYSERQPASISVRIPAKNDEAALNWYLSVKLSNGWYTISAGGHYALTAAADNTLYFNISVPLPVLHEGNYRLDLNTGSRWYYKEMTITRKDTDNYSLTY